MYLILSMSGPLLPELSLEVSSLDYIFLGITDKNYYCGKCFPLIKFTVWHKVGTWLLFPKCRKIKITFRKAESDKIPAQDNVSRKKPTRLPFSLYFEYGCHPLIKKHNWSLCSKKMVKKTCKHIRCFQKCNS